MRILLISALIFIVTHSNAQQDYFYAETLIDNGQHAEAGRVLDHLIDSGAYTDQPRFAMMTLNLAGNNELYLHDTLAAKKHFEAAMVCYDTLSKPHKSDDWNHREYYKAGEDLAWIHYRAGKFTEANNLLHAIGSPGLYYSATGSDVLAAEDSYCRFRSFVFQKLNQPDSAFSWILKIRDIENPIVKPLDSIFNNRDNYRGAVMCIPYSMKSTNQSLASPGYLYFATWHDEHNTQNSIWFVNPEYGDIRIIGISTYNMEDTRNFPANCYDMSLSPDEKYLAVTCYTEGSNNIDIFSFPEILNEQRCTTKQSFDAYPFQVDIKGWQSSQLVVESEADLTRLNKKVRPNWNTSIEENPKELYLYDVEIGKFVKK